MSEIDPALYHLKEKAREYLADKLRSSECYRAISAEHERLRVDKESRAQWQDAKKSWRAGLRQLGGNDEALNIFNDSSPGIDGETRLESIFNVHAGRLSEIFEDEIGNGDYSGFFLAMNYVRKVMGLKVV